MQIMLSDVIHYPTFFVSLTIGILLVYVTCPKKEIVQKFPSPYHAEEHVYKDDATGKCFVYKADKTECPMDKKEIINLT